MFKKIIISALASSVLLANYLSDFNSKKYDSAYEKAMQECNKECSSEELNLIMAQSAEKLGKIQEAIVAYDRVLIVNENNFEARLALANIYKENGNPELMQDELKYALTTLKLNSEQKERINSMLFNLNEKSKPYELDLQAGLEYDSNPKRWHKDYDPKGAASTFISIDGTYDYDITNNVKLGLFANAYYKKYLKKREDEFPDLGVFTIGANPKYSLENSTVGLKLSTDYITYRDKGLLYSINSEISYEHMLNDFYLYSLKYEYSRGIFADRDLKDSDYNHHSIELDNYFVYLNNILYANFGFDYENTKELFPNTTFNEINLTLGAIVPLNHTFSLKPELSYTRTNYKKPDYLDSKRSDNEFELSASLIYQIDKNQALDLNAGFSKLDSKIDDYDNQNIYTGITYNYGF